MIAYLDRFFFCLSVSFLCHLSLTAQDEHFLPPLSLGFYAPYGIQPGVSVRGRFPLKYWEKERVRKKGAIPVSKALNLNPQLAFFSRPGNHLSYLLGADVGYRSQRTDHRFFSSWSIGLGYLLAFQVTSISVDLGSGSQEKERERRGYFLPTLNYELGHALSHSIAWYSRFSFGRKMSTEIEDSAFFGLELGITFTPGNGQKES